MTTSDGLPSNSVRCIYQDSKGFLWLGTLNGLCRYDGNTFLTLQPRPADTGRPWLADNRINKLVEDSHGFLWVGTFNERYSCYDLQRACFVDYAGPQTVQLAYTSLLMARNGDVWLWHRGNGARRIMVDDDRRVTSVAYNVANGTLTDDNVRLLMEDSRGRIWIATRRSLTCVTDGRAETEDEGHDFRFAFERGQAVYFVTERGEMYTQRQGEDGLTPMAVLAKVGGKLSVTDVLSLPDRCILLTTRGTYAYCPQTDTYGPEPLLGMERARVTTDSRGDYWLWNHTGKVAYIDHRTGRTQMLTLIPPERLKYVDSERYTVAIDQDGTAWISTYGNGLWAYRPQDETLQHFAARTDGSGVPASDYLLCVAVDRKGHLWTAAEHLGLTRLEVTNRGITRLMPEGQERTDRSNCIRLLTRLKDGTVWAGTRNGALYAYNPQLELRHVSRGLQTNVYAVAQDSTGRLWMGTRGDGLCIDGHWHHRIPADSTSLAHSHIFCLTCDTRGRMWVGTFGGGLDLAVEQQDGSFTFRHHLQHTYGQRNVRALMQDSSGWMWVGTGDGIGLFHPDSLLADPSNYQWFNLTKGTFGSNEIRCLMQDSRGRIWVGTSGAGLCQCRPSDDYRTLQYETFGTRDGLVSDVVQAVLEDDGGCLWVATEYGLSRFNPENRSCENYFFSAHRLGNVYSENSACRLDDGRLLLGTNDGLILIDPAHIPVNPEFAPVVLTDLRVNGTRMTPAAADAPLQRDIAYCDELHLKHYQNSIELRFSTLSFADGGTTKYMHRLENYDLDWSEPSALSFASYKYLEPGNYVLRVKACNDAGVWDERETILRIVVYPPAWLSPWALVVYVLLVAVAMVIAVRIVRNFNRLQARIAVEKQLTEYKLRFFTNISHEFRTPLTLIQGSMEKMQRLGGVPVPLIAPLHTMDKSVHRLLRLVNQLLEFRKMQNGRLALALEQTDAVAFIYEIYLTFEDVAEQKKMDYRFDAHLKECRMPMDKGNVDKVVYNLLSNAFKYTPVGGRVTVTVACDDERRMLVIEVADTGVGIPREKQPKLFSRFMQSSFARDSIGVGLHLTHELVTVHKGTIAYSENPGGGSVFRVCLPMDSSVYAPTDFLQADSLLLKEDNASTAPASSSVPADTMSDEAASSSSVTDTSAAPVPRRHILIVEDDPEIRTFLQEELHPYFDTDTAPDGFIGLQRAATTDPDLIICDVLMPGLTGFEVTRRLKSDFATSHIPIVLLTALGSADNQLEGIEAGADAYVQKPFSIRLLLARVQQLIEQRERLRRKFAGEPGIVQTAVCSTDRDKEFAHRLSVVLEANLGRPNFSVEEFAALMKLGRTVFYKKLRGITGYTPNEYLRIMRMKKAAELLLSEERFTVSEVAYKVGINDPFYFSKCFKQQFGVAPSVYQKGGS